MKFILTANIEGFNYFIKLLPNDKFEYVGLMDNATLMSKEKAELFSTFIDIPWEVRLIEINKK